MSKKKGILWYWCKRIHVNKVSEILPAPCLKPVNLRVLMNLSENNVSYHFPRVVLIYEGFAYLDNLCGNFDLQNNLK